MSTIKNSDSRKTQGGPIRKIMSSVVVVLVSIAAAKTVKVGDPLSYMLPNFLLFTPLHRFAVPLWRYLDPTSRLPMKNIHKPVRTIAAEDYTVEKFKELTENFRYPAVVKGLFKNTTAVKKWTETNYLTDKIGHFDVKVAVS